MPLAFDLLILTALLAGGLAGARQGGHRAARIVVGVAGGGTAGAYLPVIAGAAPSAPWLPGVASAASVTLAWACYRVSIRLAGVARDDGADGATIVSRTTGALVGTLAAGLAGWFLVGLVAGIGGRPVAAAAENAFLVDRVDRLLGRRGDVRLPAPFDALSLFAGHADARIERVALEGLAWVGAAASRESLVAILASACEGGAVGSGWAAGSGIVVTNAHVVAGARKVFVRDVERNELTGTVVHLDHRTDVALVLVDGLAAVPLRLSPLEAWHEPVLVATRHGDLAARASRATTVLGHDEGNWLPSLRDVLPLSAIVEDGDSGSPVLAGDGTVVAMLFGSSRDGLGSVAVTRDDLARALAAPTVPLPPATCTT